MNKFFSTDKIVPQIDPLGASGFRIPIAFLKDKYNIKKDLSNDLELSKGENPLYQAVFSADDDFKKLTISQHATWYTTNKKYLRDTQCILKENIPSYPLYEKIMTLRTTNIIPADFIDKYNYIGWDKLQFINKNSQAMQYMSIYNICSPVLSLALPFFMLLLPFFMIRLQNNSITWGAYYQHLQIVLRNHSLGQIFFIGSATLDKQIMIAVSMIFYLVQVYFNFQSCIKFVKNMIQIHEHVFCVREYLNETITSFVSIESNWSVRDTYKPFIDKCSQVRKKATTICKDLGKISQLSVSFAKMCDIGQVMRAYYMINNDAEWKETIEFCIHYNSYIHSLHSLKQKIGSEINFCKYGNNTIFKGLVYPHINFADAVTNDVVVDKNIIITGPNAAGKTTILKSVMINVILCQQYGCGYFKKAKLMPYNILSSYINIPDTSGRDSLFQAEASRCKAILDDIDSDHNKRHLCIFDELFSGTNPYEAIGAATAYLNYIGSRNNIQFILTTHFLDLCRRLDKNCNVKNMQMQVQDDKKLGFTYTYKMICGISDVKGGIKVLKDLGYPESIIEESSSIIADLKL